MSNVSAPQIVDIASSHLEMKCRSLAVSVCTKGLCIDASDGSALVPLFVSSAGYLDRG
jgi:hypothetical protein